MVPITVTRTIDQTEVPSETAASSAALTWPVIATSATPMPTVASWPTSIGHDRRHRALVAYDFNDQTGSIIVNEGRWQLCEHADFGGRCIVLEPGRYEQLDNMNDRISSLRRLR
jgi:hypothetical protein